MTSSPPVQYIASARAETRTRDPCHVRTVLSPLSYARIERAMGIEPTYDSLENCGLTSRLHPHSSEGRDRTCDVFPRAVNSRVPYRLATSE